MSGPIRNHVEARSSRVPARQYVSDTHDHKPDAPVDFFVGTKLEIEEIVLGLNVLTAKTKQPRLAYDNRQPADMKVAAADIAKTSSQISTLAHHLTAVTTKHVNRRPR